MAAFNVVVLGGGPAATQIAPAVARAGKSVALIEAGLIGGESPYLACLPSKSLLLSAARGESWADAVTYRDVVTGGLSDLAAEQRVAAAGVTIFRGTGRVTAPGTITVDPGKEPGEEPGSETASQLTYTDLVIAAGSEPVAPPIEGLTDIPAWTTAESLSSADLPRRLIVLGGGPAGCELAQIYAAFGSLVTLVEAEERLLPGEPAFTGEILAGALRRAGIEVNLGSPAAKAERTGDGLTLALADGTRIDANRLLLATGRRPRLSGLGLDVLGITVAPGASLPTTRTCQVADADGNAVLGGHLWAAGDVTGTGHTHAGRYQAGIVAANLTSADPNAERREADYSAMPRAVFTSPEVFTVGTEAAGTEAEGVLTARAYLAATAKSQAAGGTDDQQYCLELYADPAAGVLVGGAAVGPDAAAWMAEITLAIRARIPITILADLVHAFPAYGEAVEEAVRQLVTGINGKHTSDREDREVSRVSDMSIETPEHDAIEQQQELVEDEDSAVTRRPRPVPFDVNEADAAEQDRSVGFDDDDYR
jgi:pyruvate/2-oxoglutarate dehydrogenase complex dihydrolipoamide dehydrogenase (E3) component